MCGLAGLYSPVGAIRTSLVQAMTDIIRYRGPDGEGSVLMRGSDLVPECYAGPDTPRYDGPLTVSHPTRDLAQAQDGDVRVSLGHRRLSIIDLSPLGHQPMATTDGDVWVVYNGEIYNHVELRRELEELGHVFRSHSDTEVLLAAWRQWGQSCLSRFNGMFSFILVDRRRRVWFMARDRFGVKPLYYRIGADGTLAAASEIKQFTVLPDWSSRLNGDRAYDFLVGSILDHTDETLFRGVYQVPPGCYATIDLAGGLPSPGSRLTVQRWYDLQPRPFKGSFADAAAEFRALLTDSVRLRLRADVKVGSCLSGGLDSSSIVCLMSEILREQGGGGGQHTFTAGSTSKAFDERDFAGMVIAKTGVTPHFTLPSSEDAFRELDDLLWHQDEPFGSSSIFAQRKVFQLARSQDVIVMLDGQGADEQLAGYRYFFPVHIANLIGRLRLGSAASELSHLHRNHGDSPLAIAKTAIGQLTPEPAKRFTKSLLRRDDVRPGWLNIDALGVSPHNPHAVYRRGLPSVHALSRSQLTGANLQMLLHWEDRNSMAASIEARVPFLDYRLVEHVLGLPDEYKLWEGTTKRVLRESMAGLLPEAVRTRMDKLGFATAEEVWMREERPQAFRDALRSAIESSQGLIHPSAAAALDEMISGRIPFSFQPWRMITFGAWMRRFSVTV